MADRTVSPDQSRHSLGSESPLLMDSKFVSEMVDLCPCPGTHSNDEIVPVAAPFSFEASRGARILTRSIATGVDVRQQESCDDTLSC